MIGHVPVTYFYVDFEILIKQQALRETVPGVACTPLFLF